MNTLVNWLQSIGWVLLLLSISIAVFIFSWILGAIGALVMLILLVKTAIEHEKNIKN